ncbi:uncharacterized protein LOC143807367 [Ranitomeya variabilis]|uniref:uncharacterized protein LOC143807367 n=1 Tax=Ranitomeya variabilis TaxID=490064 RepID=UPI00405642C9
MVRNSVSSAARGSALIHPEDAAHNVTENQQQRGHRHWRIIFTSGTGLQKNDLEKTMMQQQRGDYSRQNPSAAPGASRKECDDGLKSAAPCRMLQELHTTFV